MFQKKSVKIILIILVLILAVTSPLIVKKIKYMQVKSKAVDLILKDYNNASADGKDSYEHSQFKINNKETIGEILKFIKKGTVVKVDTQLYKPLNIIYESIELPSGYISVFDFDTYTLGMALPVNIDGQICMKLNDEDRANLLNYLKNLKVKIKK